VDLFEVAAFFEVPGLNILYLAFLAVFLDASLAYLDVFGEVHVNAMNAALRANAGSQAERSGVAIVHLEPLG
jgi:hypothetical protein